MAVDERSRHELFTRLEEVLGKEHATVLIEHLPPVGWADVATKRDLDQLEEKLGGRIETAEERLLATFRAEMNAQTRTMIFGTTAMFVGVTSLALTAARFI